MEVTRRELIANIQDKNQLKAFLDLCAKSKYASVRIEGKLISFTLGKFRVCECKKCCKTCKAFQTVITWGD